MMDRCPHCYLANVKGHNKEFFIEKKVLGNGKGAARCEAKDRVERLCPSI